MIEVILAVWLSGKALVMKDEAAACKLAMESAGMVHIFTETLCMGNEFCWQFKPIEQTCVKKPAQPALPERWGFK